MHHLGEVVQSAVCAVRTYSVYEPETLFFINMTEERLQCMSPTVSNTGCLVLCGRSSCLEALGVLGVMYSYRTALVYESSMMVRHSVNGVT